MKKEDWQPHIAEYRRSGQSCREFCEQRQLPFYRFRAVLGRAKRTTTTFVEITPPRTTHEGTYVLTLANGRTLSIPPSFNEKTLTRLLQTLDGGSLC